MSVLISFWVFRWLKISKSLSDWCICKLKRSKSGVELGAIELFLSPGLTGGILVLSQVLATSIFSPFLDLYWSCPRVKLESLLWRERCFLLLSFTVLASLDNLLEEPRNVEKDYNSTKLKYIHWFKYSTCKYSLGYV